jgi:hypothetical protein
MWTYIGATEYVLILHDIVIYRFISFLFFHEVVMFLVNLLLPLRIGPGHSNGSKTMATASGVEVHG